MKLEIKAIVHLLVLYVIQYAFCLKADSFDYNNIWRDNGRYATIGKFAEFRNFHQKSVRERMERVHGLDGYTIKKLSDHNLGPDKKNVLVLPYSLPHLRETLNFLFLLASEDSFLSMSSDGSVDRKISWVTKIRAQVNASHPGSFTPNQCDTKKVLQEINSWLEKNKRFSLEDVINKILNEASLYQILRYIRAFDEFDRVGYSHDKNSVGLVYSGYKKYHDVPFVSVDSKGKMDKCKFDFDDNGKICGYKNWSIKDGPDRKYMDLVDVGSRMVVDFSKIDSQIAVPITKEMTTVFDDWQDSAGIRFFIGDKTYDVYFPTRWSNLHYDISNSQTTTYSEFERSYNLGTEELNDHMIETQDKIRFFKYADGELSYFNYGYYPMQTPRLIKAFEKVPLHAIWSVNRGLDIRFSDDPLNFNYGSTTSIDDWGHSYKFELIWDNRFSFFPEEFVSEVQYLGGDRARRLNNLMPKDQFNRSDQCFSKIVPFYHFDEAKGFSQLLQKSVDSVTHPFVWEKGIDLGYKNRDDELYAEKREKIINYLISIIQNRDAYDKEGEVELFCDGNEDDMKKIISSQMEIDDKGNQLIHYICYYNLAGVVDQFLEIGNNVDAQNKDGVTPLMIASQHGFWETFEKLMEHNPSIDLLDNKNQTALTYATRTSKSGAVGVGIGLAALPLSVAAVSSLGAAELVGGGMLSNIASQAVAAGALSGSSAAMRGLVLPNKSCNHAFFCNHSKIRDELLERGANPEYMCSKALGLLHGTFNGLLAPSRKFGEVFRSLIKGDNAHMKYDDTYLSEIAAQLGLERYELVRMIQIAREEAACQNK